MRVFGFRATHAKTLNGDLSMEFKDQGFTAEPLAPEAHLLKSLSALDGSTLYAFSIWKLPDGVRFHKVNLKKWPQEYVQAAGSREKMTVEIRRRGGDGYAQYTVGREGVAKRRISRKHVVIRWDEFKVKVLPHEVFDAESAAEVFIAYYKTDTIPEGYTLRRLEL